MIGVKQRNQLKLPQKSDYPHSIRILDKPGLSAEYHQLLEASASAYFETKGPTRWLFMKRFKTALNYLGQIGRVESILDAGTGIGFFLPTLSQFAKSVIAVDYAHYTLAYARSMCRQRKITNVSFTQADLLTLKLPKHSVNVINTLSVLEHIPPAELPALMAKFKTWLKPEGYLIAGWPNEGGTIFKLAQTWEKRLLRPRMLHRFKDEKRHYKPLGHVSQNDQIYRAVTKAFKTIHYQFLPLPWLKFYSLGLFTQ
jgi:ubiquinone/menaquinone biosynthesis C-methylase UbiE